MRERGGARPNQTLHDRNFDVTMQRRGHKSVYMYIYVEDIVCINIYVLDKTRVIHRKKIKIKKCEILNESI